MGEREASAIPTTSLGFPAPSEVFPASGEAPVAATRFIWTEVSFWQSVSKVQFWPSPMQLSRYFWPLVLWSPSKIKSYSSQDSFSGLIR